LSVSSRSNLQIATVRITWVSMFIEGVSAVKTGSAPANQHGLVEGAPFRILR
jgi:hypothetical protein